MSLDVYIYPDLDDEEQVQEQIEDDEEEEWQQLCYQHSITPLCILLMPTRGREIRKNTVYVFGFPVYGSGIRGVCSPLLCPYTLYRSFEDRSIRFALHIPQVANTQPCAQSSFHVLGESQCERFHERTAVDAVYVYPAPISPTHWSAEIVWNIMSRSR